MKDTRLGSFRGVGAQKDLGKCFNEAGVDADNKDTGGPSATDCPWMSDRPFTNEDIMRYNHFSHFDVDINKEFETNVKKAEADVRGRLFEYGITELPPDVKKALYYYRKAVYEYYLDVARAREKAPPVTVVGPSNYKGRPEKARAILDKSLERLQTAEKYLDRAIKRNISGRIRVGDKQAITSSQLVKTQLKGANLKKDLGLTGAVQAYNYNHANNTGTSSVVLKKGPLRWYRLSFDYDQKTGKVYNVKFGQYAGALEPLEVRSYEELAKVLKSKMR